MAPQIRRHVAAAVDVGSNSIHLLVAQVGPDGIRPMVDESEFLGIGSIVDGEGGLPAATRQEVVATLVRYAATAGGNGAARVALLGTEPLRRASDRSLIQAEVLAATGLSLHVLSHEQEAYLTLLGVTGGVPPSEPMMVADIGGGSSEIILAAPGRDAVIGSLPTGSARLTSAFVQHDPPTWFELDGLRREAARWVDGLPAGRPTRCVMVGGTASNLSRLLRVGERSTRLTAVEVGGLFELLSRHASTALVARYGVNRKRASLLAAGAALTEALMVRYELDSIEISEASLREGAILAGAVAGDDWPERLADLCAPHPVG